ncbi:MAG: NADH-quinone oxidoreductase subunit N [Deltaproteobacteria bacterium RBG_16_54_11]|jgi:NADH-quinone oxidoreductase subunit N|nr:MAG: NADH-quinone oxidoreductase subunit N [Deltaproteobacteria bacterium RBG_16_54_11]
MTDLLVIAPELALTGFALVILLMSAFARPERRGFLGYTALLGVVAAMVSLYWGIGVEASAFGGMVRIDPLSFFFKAMILLICLLIVLVSLGYAKREGIGFGEYYVLILFAAVGMMLMASGVNLLIIFLGLEVMSISIYILAGIMRDDTRSVEAAFKYFLLGAFASAFLLYGIALIYASTGTLDLAGIGRVLAEQSWISGRPILITGVALLTVGFGFKLALVPFHMWTPDVYEGAPTSITAFMATGVKAAGFAAFVRVFFYALPSLQAHWTQIMWILAVATMTVGNIIALSQSNIKRMLAYSSIAHAGYILVAFVAGNELGISGILFYLLAYVFMNIGAFTVVILLGKKGEENTLIGDYAGIGYHHPLLALAMAVFMFSLAGVPPTAGFMAKFYVFSAAVKADYYWLAVIGVLNSAVAAYYYLRVLIYMYFREPEREQAIGGFSPAAVLAIIISVWGVLQMGILPSAFLALARQSIQFLL